MLPDGAASMITTSFAAAEFTAHGAPPDLAVADYEEFLAAPDALQF